MFRHYWNMATRVDIFIHCFMVMLSKCKIYEACAQQALTYF